MGYLEHFEITADGAGWTSAPLSIGDEIETVLALEAGDYTLLCVVCLVPIESGKGHCYCDTHAPRKGN